MPFPKPDSLDKQTHETGTILAPRFNADGLIPVIAQDRDSKKVLMMAWMDATALDKTIATGQAHYWSRSRQTLWLKGETSGQIQTVHALHIDCDQDTILLMVSVGGNGGCCHVGYENCFFREVSGVDNSLSTTGVKA